MSLLVFIPAYSYSEKVDNLMLESLSNQSDLNFSLLFIDPFKLESRKEKVKEFGQKCNVQSLYFPYERDFRPRDYDWGIMNVPFMLWEGDRVFRYQQNRLIDADLIRFINGNPGRNIGFERKNCYNVMFPPSERMLCKVAFSEVDQNTDYLVQYEPDLSCIHASHVSSSTCENSGTAYGDWVIKVDEFLKVNGIDEAMTTIHHFEDIEFNMRWDAARSLDLVSDFLMAKGLMLYMDGSHRLEVETIRRTTAEECPVCKESELYWDALVNQDNNTKYEEVGFLGEFKTKQWFYCRNCKIALPRVGFPHLSSLKKRVRKHHLYSATIGINGYGRDINKIRNDVTQTYIWDERVGIINNSWKNEDYYLEEKPPKTEEVVGVVEDIPIESEIVE